MAEEEKAQNNNELQRGVNLSQSQESRWSVQRYRGFLPYESARKLKFGEGNKTIKFDVLQGFWAGNEVYSVSTFRMTSNGTIERIVLKNHSALPATCIVGEIAFSAGTLYVCKTANNWVST